MKHGVVIAGGGLAAQRCCERLRRAGFDGPIFMVCEEPVAPYDRPPLSKQYLAGKMTETPRLRPDDWYADNAVELLLGRRATRLRPYERELELDGSEVLRYDRLLVATGASPRMIPGWERFSNVHVLRTLADAERLRDRLAPGARVAVVGAGFIGQEVASTASNCGAEVTLVEAMPAPLAHIVGEKVGGWFAQLHREHGVAVRLGAGVERAAGNGRVETLELADGATVGCDEVVVGIGVKPATGWLAGSGLDPDGIAVDHAGRTAIPNVFAAGDCARSQHWEAAVQQGSAAALAMLGQSPPPAIPSSFWSDLYGTRVNWLGDATDAHEVVLDGEPESRDFSAVYRREGRVVAGLLVGRPRALPELRRQLQASDRKDADHGTDPEN